MAALFEPASEPAGGAVTALDEGEISVLRSLTVQLLELIGPGPGGGERNGAAPDLLESLFHEGPSEPPTDPVLARLFPNAYGGPGVPEDRETRARSAEFRRYTEDELRARKRDDGVAVVRALDALDASDGGAVLRLTREEAQQWLGALNDLRLALAARLEITDDETTETLLDLPDQDPAKPLVIAYLWLGALQDSLVETLLD